MKIDGNCNGHTSKTNIKEVSKVGIKARIWNQFINIDIMIDQSRCKSNYCVDYTEYVF